MTKHQPISDALRSEIEAGKYADGGGRLPSEEALCRRWKVSRPTVARALRDLQLQGWVDRRAGAGTFIRAERRPLQVTLGLLVEGLGKTEILDPLCAEITRAAQQRGCGVFTGGLPQGRRPEELAESWAARGVKGVFFAPIGEQTDREVFNLGVVKALRNSGLVVVLLDRDATEFPKRSDCDLVALDNFHAGYDMGRHLVDAGCQRVLFVAEHAFLSSTDLRFAGLRGALIEAGLPPADLHSGEISDAAFVGPLIRKTPRYDACVGSNDQNAARFMQAAAGLGCKVPDDLRLAGFDDAGFATLLTPSLTTIRQPCRYLGITCIDAILGRIQHPELPARLLLLRGELVVRASTGGG
ncbi:MAG: substrate-binding domain-containing protein [Terrimicrobiaceae bacterium]|jgi:LacI family transcriptional regulator